MRPATVGRQSLALALHPDQAEIAARRAMCDVAFIEQRELPAQLAQAERDRRADQTAADDRHVEPSDRHRTPGTPANRRIAGSCGTKSVYA